jgi:hypothetical protein
VLNGCCVKSVSDTASPFKKEHTGIFMLLQSLYNSKKSPV